MTDTMYALIIWLLFIIIFGLVADQRKLRKRNRELDDNGAKLMEQYMRATARIIQLSAHSTPPSYTPVPSMLDDIVYETHPSQVMSREESGSMLRAAERDWAHQTRADRGQGRP